MLARETSPPRPASASGRGRPPFGRTCPRRHLTRPRLRSAGAVRCALAVPDPEEQASGSEREDEPGWVEGVGRGTVRISIPRPQKVAIIPMARIAFIAVPVAVRAQRRGGELRQRGWSTRKSVRPVEAWVCRGGGGLEAGPTCPWGLPVGPPLVLRVVAAATEDVTALRYAQSMVPRRSTTVPDLIAQLDAIGVAPMAVIVFGSVARRSADQASDLDVLVVVDDEESRRVAAEHFREVAINRPLILSEPSLLAEAVAKPSFVSHILDEGVPIRGGSEWDRLRSTLTEIASDPSALEREIKTRAQDLEPLTHVERYASSPVTVLSHLWGVSRSLVIARLLQAGVREYDWRRAFQAYGDLHPELRDDLASLESLRPYYEIARAREGARLPDEYIDERRLRDLVASAAQLAK